MFIGILKLLRSRSSSSFTLMFIPHSEHSVSRMSIPSWLLKLVSALLVVGVISLLWFGVRYWQMRESMSELKALRSINETQQSKLRSLEAEAIDMREEMLQIKYLEQDVRNMLEDDELADRSGFTDSRDYPLSGRGGGPERKVVKEQRSPLGFLSRPSFREKTEEWNEKYSLTTNLLAQVSSQTEDIKEELETLKEDVAKRKDYLAARPSGLPARGEISCDYGYRRSPFSGRTEFHPAVDIATRYGAPVVATGKGKVVFAGYRSGYGQTVIIQHPYGFMTMYGHNSSILVNVGETVSRGEIIARAGSSGNSTGPHVHYEVFVKGVNVDPGEFC